MIFRKFMIWHCKSVEVWSAELHDHGSFGRIHDNIFCGFFFIIHPFRTATIPVVKNGIVPRRLHSVIDTTLKSTIAPTVLMGAQCTRLFENTRNCTCRYEWFVHKFVFDQWSSLLVKWKDGSIEVAESYYHLYIEIFCFFFHFILDNLFNIISH